MDLNAKIGLVLAGIVLALPSVSGAECATRSATLAPHVVELYTSEGCSSCPPAEKWLRALSQSNPGIVTLEFHVDYWDSLGWRDRFSDARYTHRQQQLAENSAHSVVYTPEVILDGREWRTWSGDKLPAASAPMFHFELSISPGAALKASLSSVGPSAPTGATEWYLAVTEAHLASTVTAGENRGTKLLHDNVVRALAGPRAVSESIVMTEIPSEVDYEHASVIALVVDAKTSRAIAAERLSLAGCPQSPQL